jgi:vancomycin resistance protein YoaR
VALLSGREWWDDDTEEIPVHMATRVVVPPDPPAPPATPPAPPPARSGRRLARLVPAAVLGALALAYLIDLVAGVGEVARGVSVAGVEVGGLSRASARQALIDHLGDGLPRVVTLRAGSAQAVVVPADLGLAVDWTASVAAAGGQPLNPITRFTSLFEHRDVPLVSTVDPARLGATLGEIADAVRTPATEGGLRFDGVTPTAVQPAEGTELDVPAAAAQIRSEWTTGLPVALPLRRIAPSGGVTAAGIQRALTEVARPAVAQPVRVIGRGRNGTLNPGDIADALTFTPDGSGGLAPVLDIPALVDIVRPELADTEQPARDASVSLVGGAPKITASVDGRGVDYRATFAKLLDVLREPGPRQVTAVYVDQRATLNTAQLGALDIKDVISTFSTGGFAVGAGENIERAARKIDGTVLRPGETFSLNAATGPRGAAQGYVPAGGIDEGRPADGVGGGVSQLATTLYNAAYFAGLTDVEHREHGHYISRYPVAREATVLEKSIDLKFRNDLPHAVLIQTIWTPADITVKIWGTKRYEVTSTTSPRTDLVPPQELTLPPGPGCVPSDGAPGFTAIDTRTMRDLATGRTTTSTRTARYRPSPRISCTGAQAALAAAPR